MHFIKFFFAFITYVFDGVVWWSDWRRRRWRRPWLGGCRKVCSHIIICCFLWRYRGVQFKHNIGSLLHGSSLCTLQYISFLLPNREYNSFKRIGRTHYKLSVLLHEWFSSWTLSSMSNTLVISTLVKIQWSTFFPQIEERSWEESYLSQYSGQKVAVFNAGETSSSPRL